MTDKVAQFYDELAPHYHLIFGDWKRTVLKQSLVLDGLIRHRKEPPPLSVLDCSCGIGTQAIGLALRGHDVVAADVSPVSVERARREAASFGVALDARVADMRRLTEQLHGAFQAVISCDNSIAHLCPDELAAALAEMRELTARGGVVLLGLRDYDRLAAERSATSAPTMAGEVGGRTVTLQLWEWWADGGGYDATLLFLSEGASGWRTSAQQLQLHAHRRRDVAVAMERAGLRDLRWHEPAASGYYQPVATARRA